MLARYQKQVVTIELQLGFKRKHFAHMCTMVQKETISHYTNNRSSVCCNFSDATEVTDKVQYCKLFHVLEKRGLQCQVLHILISFTRVTQYQQYGPRLGATTFLLPLA
jgi:hypothetical protein